jgi:predicted component of type VI protein secretion system
MAIRLILKTASKPPIILRLDPGETLVGRNTECKLRIPSSDVSRQHCVLKLRDEKLTVVDLDSANGTFVNGIAVKGKQLAAPGDRIQVGPVTLLVQLKPTEPAEPLPPKKSGQGTTSTVKVPLPGSKKKTKAQSEPAIELEDEEAEESLDDIVLLEPVEDDPEDSASLNEIVLAEEDDNDQPIEGVELILDEKEQLHLPQSGEIRNLLNQLDDSPTSKRKKR